MEPFVPKVLFFFNLILMIPLSAFASYFDDALFIISMLSILVAAI
jgi:hypothetical protein